MTTHPPSPMATVMILLSICSITNSFAFRSQFGRSTNINQPLISSLHRINRAVPTTTTPFSASTRLFLAATPKKGTGTGKKKRRRRKSTKSPSSESTKNPPTTDLKVVEDVSATAPAPSFDTAPIEPVMKTDAGPGTVDATAEKSEKREEEKKAEASTSSSSGFTFDRNAAIALGISDAEDEDDIAPAFAPPKGGVQDLPKLDAGAMALPDIKDTVKKKKSKKGEPMEEEEEVETKDRIKRGDTAGLRKLLEVDPNADTDTSYFVEEYGTVSILLGEGAKPFLGIPTGPLQVGHFIGALGIFLMAFVQYPGFPLTNLPSPLRGALQGGLGVVYLINTVLAILAIFKAGERGQPALLWAVKTFTVGGLSYDQLTQLPTTEQVEAMKAKKGKRALDKRKR